MLFRIILDVSTTKKKIRTIIPDEEIISSSEIKNCLIFFPINQSSAAKHSRCSFSPENSITPSYRNSRSTSLDRLKLKGQLRGRNHFLKKLATATVTNGIFLG